MRDTDELLWGSCSSTRGNLEDSGYSEAALTGGMTLAGEPPDPAQKAVKWPQHDSPESGNGTVNSLSTFLFLPLSDSLSPALSN